VAWEACATNYTPLVIGDLNICFEDPSDNRADAIIDLQEEINNKDLSYKYSPQ
jgi:hypothetical protein